ncbi:Rhodanese- sulfurtransferase [Bulinus truncatus]|nr:Rhodanese- sulfurtransferase [Bulinus truncatus]
MFISCQLKEIILLHSQRQKQRCPGKKQQCKPRWGYKRANDNTNQCLIEVPENADPMEDQFAKRKTEKKERVAKNELHRLQNIARSQKKKDDKSKIPVCKSKKTLNKGNRVKVGD